MRWLIKSLLFLCTTLLVISCQKEISEVQQSAQQNNLRGDYRFISLEAKTQSIQELTLGSDVEKTITVSHYFTKENKGTVTFNETTMSSKDLSYAIDTIANGYYYTNGVLIDSVELTLQFNLPSSSSSTDYKIIGTDSIYFLGGTSLISGTTQQGIPGGAKLRFEGDKLFMTSQYFNKSNTVEQGITIFSTKQATITTTLQKL